MKKTIFCDEFFAGLDSSISNIDTAQSLPPECYVDPEFFEFEKEALFAHEWLCVGRESWVSASGQYFNTSIIGEPILVVRDQAGELRAMSSVCQHRGMLVAEARGTARGFVCPYHHWSYSLDGHLVGAPAMEKSCNFEKSKVRLPQFKVEVWMGFVFINFDAAARPLAPRLAALDKVLANWDIANAEGPLPAPAVSYPFNWKVMFENNNDGYHANKLHKGHLHDFVPSSLASFPDLPRDTAGYYRLNGTTHADASFNVTQKALMPIFPKLRSEERDRIVFANLPPTLSLVLTCDMIIYFILRADGPQSHVLDSGILFAPSAMSEPAFEDRQAVIMHAAMAITAQDLHVDELVQIGLRSRFAPRGRYSWQEGAQVQFNCWLVPRYQELWSRIRLSNGTRTANPGDAPN